VQEKPSGTNEILQSVLSSMGDAVMVADRNGKFLVFNPAAERMFGRNAALYLPDRVTLFPRDQLPLERSIRGEDVNNVEIFVRNEKAPTGFWARVNGRPLRDADGKLAGGVIVCRDITESKRKSSSSSIKAASWR
jgi:PAS domain S-box